METGDDEVRTAAAAIIQMAMQTAGSVNNIARIESATFSYDDSSNSGNGAFVVSHANISDGNIAGLFGGAFAGSIGLTDSTYWWPIRYRHTSGSIDPIRFSRPTEIPISIEIDIIIDSTFSGDGTGSIRSKIVEEISGWDIGEFYNNFSIARAALSVIGHSIDRLVVSRKDGSGISVNSWDSTNGGVGSNDILTIEDTEDIVVKII